MKIEGIEEELESLMQSGADCAAAGFLFAIGPRLIAVAKAAKYMVERADNYYLHCEIKDPLLQNIKKKLLKLEEE